MEGTSKAPAAASPAHLPHWRLCLATATHAYSDKVNFPANQLLLVQGDRDDAPSGWCYALAEGWQEAALVPTSYLDIDDRPSFTAVALYDFTAADDTELSMISGEYLTLEPSAEDPLGWTTAVNRQTRARGQVPQTYVKPAGPMPSASPARPQKSPARPSDSWQHSAAHDGSDERTGDSMNESADSIADTLVPSQVRAAAAVPITHRDSAAPSVDAASATAPKAAPAPKAATAAKAAAATQQRRGRRFGNKAATRPGHAAAPSAPAAPGSASTRAASAVNPSSASGSSSAPSSPANVDIGAWMRALWVERQPHVATTAEQLHATARDLASRWQPENASLQNSLDEIHARVQATLAESAPEVAAAAAAAKADERERAWAEAAQVVAVRAAVRAAELEGPRTPLHLQMKQLGTTPEAAVALFAASRPHAHARERGGGFRGAVPPPPAGFEPSEAMDHIFHLGTLIARDGDGATHSVDGGPTADEVNIWRARLLALREYLARWYAWEDHATGWREGAACVLQASVRRRSAYLEFQVCVREARVRRLLAEQAATSIQSSRRRASVARELVTKRHAAIRLQKHWRSLCARRHAHRLRKVRGPYIEAVQPSARGTPRGTTPRGTTPRRSSSSAAPSAAEPASPRRSLANLGRSLSWGSRTSRKAAAAAAPASGPLPGSLKLPLRPLALQPLPPFGSTDQPLQGRKVPNSARAYGHRGITGDGDGVPLSPRSTPRQAFDRRGMNISTEMPGRAESAVLVEAAIEEELHSPRNKSGAIKSRGRSLSFGMRPASRRGGAAAAAAAAASPDSGAPNMGTVDLTARLHAQLFD